MTKLLFAIFFGYLSFVLSQNDNFECPNLVRSCFCYPDVDQSLEIYCTTNSSTGSNHYLRIYQRSQVIIQCTNSPSWSDFLSGNMVSNASPSKLYFSGCDPPGKVYKDTFRKQLDIFEVQFLKFNNLKRPIKPDDLEGFPESTYLSLSNNYLSEVDAELLRGLPKLEILELNEAQIKIPKNFFLNTKNLKKLELVGNNLKFLDADYFKGLEKIELLNLGQNDISEFHLDTFSAMNTLTFLDIHQNNLKSLPSGIFRNLKNLKELNIGTNNFSDLPDGLLELNYKLVIFKMMHNKINLTSLPSKMLANKPNLELITMVGSKLRTLPEDLFWNSTNIQEINLNHNHLSTLPKYIFRDAVIMKELYIKFNDISELSDNIFINNHNLQILELSHNKIKSINKQTFVGLKNLKELKIEYNDLTNIHSHAFNSLVNLQIINFKNNQLENNFTEHGTNQFSPFYSCHQLKQLDLSYNKFTKMINWTHSESLEKLDLSHNLITNIFAKNFEFALSSSVKIDLSNNKIHEVNMDDLEKIFDFGKVDTILGKLVNYLSPEGVVKVKLSENPLICDCKIHNLLRYAKNQMHPQIRKRLQLDLWTMKCASPSWYVSSSPALIDPQELNECLTPESYRSSKKVIDPCSDDSPCACYVRSGEQVLFIDCKRRDLTQAPQLINHKNMSKVFLDLQGNQLKRAPNMNDEGYEHVVIMSLAENQIDSISAQIVTSKLKVLDLSYNKLTMLDHATVEALEKTNLKVVLDRNPWKCEDNNDSRNFLRYVHVKKYNEIFNTCKNSAEVDLDSGFDVGIYGLLMTVMETICFGIILFWVAFLIAEIIAEKLDKDKIDHSVILLHKNENFVAEEILSKLEKEPWPVKASSFIKNRSIKMVANEILPKQLRCIIVILSTSFIENIWSSLEYQVTLKQVLEKNKNRIIVIQHGDIGPIDKLDAELQVFLESKTCLKWDELKFWEYLNTAMLRTSLSRITNQKSFYLKKFTEIIRNKLKKVETTNNIDTISQSIGEKFNECNSVQTIEKNFNEFI